MDQTPEKSPYASPQTDLDAPREAPTSHEYATAPIPSDNMPSGIPFIVGNEAAERFSFYGMKSILYVFMTQHLLDHSGSLDLMAKNEATGYVHLFVAAVYFFPLLGALISDIFLGKYHTILSLSVIYCLGHLALAIDDTRIGLAIGLSLIAIGAGGIKPCVSAHVGDQFGKTNQHLLSKVFSWFYFSINLGAFLSTLLTPVLLVNLGPHWAFGVPGVLMFIATVVFWMGRYRFVHVPAGGVGFLNEALSAKGLLTIGKLALLFAFIVPFWSLFDQSTSSWVEQSESLDRNFFGFELLSSQIQAFNPVMILLFIPIFSYGVYPAINSVFPLTPLRKISIGLFVTVLAFAIPAWIQMRIDAGETPALLWQVLAYVVLTSAEVMVSITCLEFAYTQAPNTMKSFVMSVFLLSIAAGNLFTSAVNFIILNPDGSSKLPGASYFWFFDGVMLATAIIFVGVAYFYKEKTYIQDEQPAH